jgi:hypothetical protein
MRCEAPKGSAGRCGQCAKAKVDCRYTSVPAVQIVNGVTDALPDVPDSGARLSTLEGNVARLLEIMERGMGGVAPPAQHAPGMMLPQPVAPQTAASHFPLDSGVGAPQVHPGMMQMPPVHAPYADQSGAMMDMGYGGEQWIGGAAPGEQSANHGLSSTGGAFDAFVPDSADMASGGGAGVMSRWPGRQSDARSDPSPTLAMQNRVQFAQPTTGISLSPTALSDHRRTPHSQQHDSTTADGEASATQARPIPDYGKASRIAALNDPSAAEAPFRSLTYNPDTYRNAELSDKDDDAAAGPSGGKTPKRGRGDPIDRGIFTEEHARALFTL